LAYITVLSAIGIAIKLSFLALGSATSVLALATWFVGRKVLDLEDKKTLVWMATVVGLVLVPWMIRGVILSGYIAFPIPLGSFPVEWRMARGDVIDVANDTRNFARQPGYDSHLMSNWNWLVPWLHRASTEYIDLMVPILLTVVGGLTGFYHRRRNPKGTQVPWLFLLPTIASILWWFMAAPNLRFAGSLFWILAAGTVTLAVQESGGSARLQLNRLADLRLLAIPAVGLFALSAFEGKTEALSVVLKDKDPVKAFRTLHLNSSANLAPAPQGKWTTFVTHSGLTIYVPHDGTTQCWDAPLPCARRALPKLRLRQEGDMSRGFILDGTQLPERDPNGAPLPYQGVLTAKSSAPFSMIGIRGRYNERGHFLGSTTLPIVTNPLPPASALFIPHFADSGGFSTQFILYNANAVQGAPGFITFFGDAGHDPVF
jgi:hypothetical protein